MEKSKRVFISRDLEVNSRFKKMLDEAGWKVIGQSLVRFSVLPFDHIPEVDWIFFYSKNAVRFFFDQLKTINIDLTGIQLAAMGPGTASSVSKQTGTIHFTGTGTPEKVAKEFLQLGAGKRVLFPHAKTSKRSIQRLLDTKIVAYDLVVYRNEIIKNVNLPPADVLVFTSPLNVQAYFANANKEHHQKVIAIGPTTAAALHGQGIENVIVADHPTEEGLARAVMNTEY